MITLVDNTNLQLARDRAEQAIQRQKAIAQLGFYALPLAKGIIELHDGRISVDSAECDRGSEFTIELLLTQSEESTSISTL